SQSKDYSDRTAPEIRLQADTSESATASRRDIFGKRPRLRQGIRRASSSSVQSRTSHRISVARDCGRLKFPSSSTSKSRWQVIRCPAESSSLAPLRESAY